MIVRRRVFCADPLPHEAGPFAHRLMTERLLCQGGSLYFEPTMRAVHDFEGWSMERDLRRQVGWTSIRIRQLDADIPGASVVRLLGPASVPMLYAHRVMESAGKCFLLPRHFGLRWRHVPLLLGLAVLVHSFEMPGTLRALRGREAGPTDYISLSRGTSGAARTSPRRGDRRRAARRRPGSAGGRAAPRDSPASASSPRRARCAA